VNYTEILEALPKGLSGNKYRIFLGVD